MSELGQGVEFHEVVIRTDVEGQNRLGKVSMVFTELAAEVSQRGRSLVWPPIEVGTTADMSGLCQGYIIPSVPNNETPWAD